MNNINKKRKYRENTERKKERFSKTLNKQQQKIETK